MTLSELNAKMPELTYSIEVFLDRSGIPYERQFFGEPTIDDANVEKAMQVYYAALERKRERVRLEEEKKQQKAEQKRLQEEQKRIEQEEQERKEQEIAARVLVTSGFNFEGYRIVKYCDCITSDNAMAIGRDWAWGREASRSGLTMFLRNLRKNALRDLRETALNLGCNAIIGVDYDYITLQPETANDLGGTTYQPYIFSIAVNGTAVVIEKIED